MSTLPRGWAHIQLGQVIELKYGKALPDRERSGDGHPVYGSNGVVGYHRAALTSGETIIVGRKGSVGEVNFSQIPCSPIDTTYYVDQFPCENPKYWFYKLKHLDLGALNKSTAIPGFNRGDAYSLTIQLPPLLEQKRIADKLDTVLARVDACRERLNRVPLILKRFRQSVLAAATSGQLTADWRGGRNANTRETNAFPLVPFGSLVKSIRGGSTEVPSNDISDFPILRSSSVRQGEVDFSDVKYLTSKQSTNINNFIESGDLLFTRLNGSVEYVGNCVAVANISSRKYQYPDRLFCAKLKDAVDPAYCMYAFSTPEVRRDIETRAKSTAGHKRISIQDVKEIEIRLPSTFEQHEIVRRIETLFAFADRLEARLATARTATDRLTPALLAKAFRGELVPQDSNDEPAAELLNRLAATRTATSGRPRRGRVDAVKGR